VLHGKVIIFIFCYRFLSFGINMKKRRVVIGVLGTVMDKRGKRANRFRKWRPTVGLCQQPDFPVDRLELIHQPHDRGMAQQIAEDIALLSPHTEVRFSSSVTASGGAAAIQR
jgi:transcriptional regulatory protein RtcR